MRLSIYLVLTVSEPQQAESAASVAKTRGCKLFPTVNAKKNLGSTNATGSLFHMAGTVESKFLCLSKGAVVPDDLQP